MVVRGSLQGKMYTRKGWILYARLSKESLNRHGHQFHKYQQNKQSPLTLTDM